MTRSDFPTGNGTLEVYHKTVRTAMFSGRQPNPGDWEGFVRRLHITVADNASELLTALEWLQKARLDKQQRLDVAKKIDPLIFVAMDGEQFGQESADEDGSFTLSIFLFIFTLGILTLPFGTYKPRLPLKAVLRRSLNVAVNVASPVLLRACVYAVRKVSFVDRSLALKAVSASIGDETDFSEYQNNSTFILECASVVRESRVEEALPLVRVVAHLGGVPELKMLKQKQRGRMTEEGRKALEKAVEGMEARLNPVVQKATLLRPAESPADTLLRPVSSTETDTAVLVRPSEEDG